ncbi:hypothetical protein POHY109586_21540 [Polaromonas hydrogenivorans]
MLCRELKLLTQAVVAVDGSKFKTVNNREREIDESIQRYLDALQTLDRSQPAELQDKRERLRGKVEKMHPTAERDQRDQGAGRKATR